MLETLSLRKRHQNDSYKTTRHSLEPIFFRDIKRKLELVADNSTISFIRKLKQLIKNRKLE